LDNSLVDSLATELLTLKRSSQIRAFRNRLDKATAQKVIRSPLISAVDRGAISLCLQFGEPHRGTPHRGTPHGGRPQGGSRWAPRGLSTEAWIVDFAAQEM
jgi:hypothetical protein